MTVSWFRGNNGGGGHVSGHHHHNHHHLTTSASDNSNSRASVKEAVKALYPPKNRFSDSFLFDLENNNRRRFSSLLLEHGEQHIQDWAVIAYTAPGKANPFLAASSPRGMSLSSVGSNLGANGGSGSNLGGGSGNSTNETQWVAAQSSSRKHKTGASSSSSSPPSSPSKKTSYHHRMSKHKQKHQQQAKLSKESHPTVHMTKIEGRLHLCSRSVVFEPTDDLSRPILRCPFNQMETPPKEFPAAGAAAKTGNYEPMCVEFLSFKHICCKVNNKIGPTSSVSVPTQFRFTFLHSKPSTLVDLCHKLFAILRMEGSTMGVSKSSNRAKKEMEALLRPMYERPFDPTNFVDVRERPLLSSNLKCHIIQPLQKHPGCLVITHERIYFQPSHGVLSDDNTSSRAMHWNQNSIIATARRYHGLQDNALEIFWDTSAAATNAQRSTLFELRNKHEREQLLRLLPTNVPCHTDRNFVARAAQEWQKKAITNYEYLLLLNSAASRSIHDLSRYPVFPWVLSDYTSEKLDLKNPNVFRDLTKPVGALNPERLSYFQQRYESLQSLQDEETAPFLYGTHYSAAGYVLYYLMRNMPEHMLCLQNGKFDAPDRMFHNIEHCFNCVLTNHADVKELIPEFYTPNYDSFLMNIKSLQLGATQLGDRVDDVILPNWAKSPRDFIKQHNRALESEMCTSMLPRWIDLIFGSKSRGDAAKEANNVFHKTAYMGPADWSNMASDDDRFQAELQATEFGIVPDQLFVGPHPLRHETVDDSFIHNDLGRNMSVISGDDGKGDAWELLDIPSHESARQGSHDSGRMHENHPRTSSTGSEVILDPAEGGRASSGDDGNVGNRNPPMVVVGERKSSISGQQPPQDRPRATAGRGSLPLKGTGDANQTSGPGAFSDMGIQPSLSNLSASSNINGSVSIQRNDTMIATTSTPSSASDWDMKIIERTKLHDEAISGCKIYQDMDTTSRPILTTTSLDGGLKVHHVTTGSADTEEPSAKGFTSTLSRFSYLSMSRGQTPSTEQTKLAEFRSHTSRDPLACLALTSDGQGGQIAFAGGHDDVVLAYGINSACAVASVYSHRDAVTGLDLVPRNPSNRATKLWREKSTHIMVSGSWDATVKVWSVTVSTGETVAIDREPLAELFDADSSIVSVSCFPMPDGSIVIASGCADGSFCVWNLHCDGVKVVIHKEPARRGSGPCSVVKWTSVRGKIQLFTGFSTGKVASYDLLDGSIRRIAAVSVGVAIQCLVYSEGILLIGCADGGLRLIQVRDDGSFTNKPTLWTAVNNKASPGITSLSLSFVTNFAEGTTKCICCTGAEDGSVALFELNKVSRRT